MMTEQMTMSQRVESLGISIDWHATGFHKEGDWEYHRYAVTLYRIDGRSISVTWKQGIGIDREPRAVDVLDSLASDAAGYDVDFDVWAGEYGYDSDSRKAYATWQAVQEQTADLRRLLGDDFDAVLYDTERL